MPRVAVTVAAFFALTAVLPGVAPAATQPTTAPYALLNDRFHVYGDAGASWQPGDPRTWTGGDSTFSVVMPDGRTVWIFSDTFLAPNGGCDDSEPEPCHRRPFLVAPFINNSFVVQEKNGALGRTLHGGTNETPTALIRPSSPADEVSFYWMGDGTVEGDRLHVFVRRYPKVPTVSPTALATDIATFRLPDLTLEAIHEGVGPDGVRPWGFVTPPLDGIVPVTWGAGILERRDFTYVYGTEEYPLHKHLHAARVPAGQLLTGTWEFYDGQGWTTDPLGSARLLSDVAGELSVVETKRGFRLVTSLLGIGEVLMYTAPAPEGPWGHRTLLLEPPEAERGANTYNAHEHPQYARPGRLVFSYNVNGEMDGKNNFEDIHIYRPRFVEVTLDEPIRVIQRNGPGRGPQE